MSAPQHDVPDEKALEKKGALFPIVAGIALLVGAAVLSVGVLSGGGGSKPMQGGPGPGGGGGGGPKAQAGAGGPRGGPGGPGGAAGAPAAAPVRVGVVERGALAKERRVPGEIVAERRAALHAELGGQVASLHKRLGEVVKGGETLVTLDAGALPAELKRAEAASEVARARAERARIVAEQRRRDVERREALHKEGAVSVGELDSARTEQKTADVDLALAAAEARRADADMEALRVRLGQTRVRAPFDGRIAAVHVDQGTIVSGGRLLLEVVTTSAPLVRFSVGEGDAAQITPKARLKVKTPVGEREAEVLRVGAAVDPDSRTLPVEARLLTEGATSDALPGMFVEVTLAASAPEGALVVPLAALAGKGALRTAFVVDEGGRAKAASVRVLLDDGERAAVDGLAEGQRIVTSGVDGLSDGAAVEVVP